MFTIPSPVKSLEHSPSLGVHASAAHSATAVNAIDPLFLLTSYGCRGRYGTFCRPCYRVSVCRPLNRCSSFWREPLHAQVNLCNWLTCRRCQPSRASASSAELV